MAIGVLLHRYGEHSFCLRRRQRHYSTTQLARVQFGVRECNIQQGPTKPTNQPLNHPTNHSNPLHSSSSSLPVLSLSISIFLCLLVLCILFFYTLTHRHTDTRTVKQTDGRTARCDSNQMCFFFNLSLSVRLLISKKKSFFLKFFPHRPLTL